MNNIPSTLRGIIPPMITPLLDKTATCISGRVPLLVGITDASFYESLKIARIAADNNASALVAAPPYYFALGQPELVEYYEALATQSPLPLYLYNMPSHTKIMIEMDTVKALTQHENIIGLKDSSASGVYFCKLLHLFHDRPDFGLYVGPEEMMASMVLMGAHGGVTGGANVYPEIYVKTFHAAAAKDVEGICSDVLAQPFNRFLEKEKEKVKIAIEKLDKIVCEPLT